MDADSAEEILEKFTARATVTAPPEPVVQGVASSDEDVVEGKARQKRGRQAYTVQQKRTTIPESQLERRIAATIKKYPDIVEGKIRQDLADQIEENGDNGDDEDITEEQFSEIVNAHIKKSEQDAQGGTGGPLISPPPFASQAAQGLQDKVTQAADRAAGLATPGGVGLLVFVLIFFIWAIIPVSNGKTRLQLLWAVLTNQAYFPDDIRGASGNFGDDSTPAATPAPTTKTTSTGGNSGGGNNGPLLTSPFEDN